MDLLPLAKAVKRGVKLLDRKVPNWRQVLRKHRYQFDFSDGAHCVLGTLEHHSGRLAVLKKRQKVSPLGWSSSGSFSRARQALSLTSADAYLHGFDYSNRELNKTDAMVALDALWRAEFEKDAQ